jgi:hypothetical protein
MSLMTTIDGIPLYTTKKEALNWAISNGIRGYHKHVFRNKTGYMGGVNHAEISNAIKNNVNIQVIQTGTNQDRQQQSPPSIPPPPQTTTRTNIPTTRNTSTRRNSGGNRNIGY